MVRIEKIKGKNVIGKRGFHIGKVEDVELDDNNWTVTTVYVRLTDEIAKVFGSKGGFMVKQVVPLPGSLMGPIGEDTIYLKEEITDANALLEKVEKHRAIM